MTPTLSTILAYMLIYLIYLLGKLVLSLKYHTYEQHIFLGMGQHPAFTFSLGAIKISMGLFIPLPYLGRFYSCGKDGSKERLRLAWEYTNVPIWQRLLVNFGGAFSMLLMAIVFFLIVGFVEKESVLEAITYGFSEPFRLFWINIRALYIVLFGGITESDSLSGPIGIAQVFGEWSWLRFIRISGLMLAGFVFYEFLPLPKTAMTRTIPLITEGFLKKPFRAKLYYRIDQIFWSLIILVFIWTIYRDISQLL